MLCLFPPVQQIPKVAAEDMRIVLGMENSQRVSSSISSGTTMFGLVYYSRDSGRESTVLSAQRELIVKKERLSSLALLLSVSTPSTPTAQPWSHFDVQTIPRYGKHPEGSTLNVL